MPDRITYRNLPQLFLKARECLMMHFRPILNHFGLTEQQWRILRTLDERGQLEPWEICNICQILSASMPGVLSRMDTMGLVQRIRIPEDQRRVLVNLTANGEQRVAEIAPLVEEQYRLIEQAFGKDLYNNLFLVLETFVEAAADQAMGAAVRHVELPAKNTAPTAAPQKNRIRA